MYHITQSLIAIPSGGSIFRSGVAGDISASFVAVTRDAVELEDRLILANVIASDEAEEENLWTISSTCISYTYSRNCAGGQTGFPIICYVPNHHQTLSALPI